MAGPRSFFRAALRSWIVLTVIGLAVIGGFWGAWLLATGTVPAVDQVRISPSLTLLLPFNVSRWWDLASVPVVAAFAAVLMTAIEEEPSDDFSPNEIAVIIIGCTILASAGIVLWGLVAVAGLGAVQGVIGGVCGSALWLYAPGTRKRLMYAVLSFLSFGLALGLSSSLGIACGVAVMHGPVAGALTIPAFTAGAGLGHLLGTFGVWTASVIANREHGA